MTKIRKGIWRKILEKNLYLIFETVAGQKPVTLPKLNSSQICFKRKTHQYFEKQFENLVAEAQYGGSHLEIFLDSLLPLGARKYSNMLKHFVSTCILYLFLLPCLSKFASDLFRQYYTWIFLIPFRKEGKKLL